MRLFVAINFTPELKGVLLDAVSSLRACADGNFTRPENLHLTLAFIGETRDAAGAKAALGDISAAPFELAIGGTGRFGDTYWAGIEKSAALTALASAVQGSLRARGFDIERRPFKPHITLARQLSPAGASVALPRASMTVRRVSLMRSERINGRLTYTELYARELL